MSISNSFGYTFYIGDHTPHNVCIKKYNPQIHEMLKADMPKTIVC